MSIQCLFALLQPRVLQIAEYTKTHFYSGHKKLSLVIYIHRF